MKIASPETAMEQSGYSDVGKDTKNHSKISFLYPNSNMNLWEGFNGCLKIFDFFMHLLADS